MDEEPSEAQGPGRRRRKRRKAPPRISAGDFERAALRHLERYPSSSAGLRAVLERRAERSRTHHGDEEDREATAASIEATLARMSELGFLDDRRYGQALAQRIRGRGGSLRKVAAALHEKGISGALRAQLLEEVGDAEAELEAALTYARRRRLGVHRRGNPLGAPEADTPGDCEHEDSERAERQRLKRKKELGALARAGFSFEVAARALDTP
ncbi:MAG: RecX family transcriptional regulator [Myxococcota bacterium]|nr:RecX family transcriptional regulator [Myxococcota bacterium]